MSKNFRLHQGVDAIDWQYSSEYGSQVIAEILDPTGANATREITSIPSPFARIDLSKAAFEFVALGDLDGRTIYNKMVSDCLDVAEIFFNIDKHSDKVEIISWDRDADLNSLLKSELPEHRLLGETIKTFLLQDKRSYNFDKLQCIYMLQYKKGGPQTINILGGTSPASLFFSSANDLNYVGIVHGTDTVFDDKYLPLYKRDFEFVKFFFALSKSIPNFSSLCKTVNDYLVKTREKLSEENRQIIDNLTSDDYEAIYDTLPVSDSAGHLVEVMGVNLRKRRGESVNLEQTSDFVIAATQSRVRKPLVLPNTKNNGQFRYTTANWDSNTIAPYKDDASLSERRLPGVNDKYPYLTVSDLLEPYIIQTIYPIDSKRFFTGNPKGFSKDDNGYILPLKRAFFDYFTVEDLKGYANGEHVVEIQKVSSGAIKVVLRIPIKCGRNITFERIYYPQINETKCADTDEKNNKGAIIEQKFSIAIFPFLKTDQNKGNFYRVGMFDRDVSTHNKSNKYSLLFNNSADNNQKIEIEGTQKRSRKDEERIATDYYVLHEGFDYIEMRNSFASGIIVPMFIGNGAGNSKFDFAVDFGTTNTHIEYRIDDGEVKPLEINANDSQIATLHDWSHEGVFDKGGDHVLHNIINQEMIPIHFGDKGGEYKFPVRTAIANHKNLDLLTSTFAMADLNMSFIYEKVKTFNNQSITTNLKWSISDDRKVEAYLESILFIIRNKILLNGGNLSKTTLTWFYPSSMSPSRRAKLESIWTKFYKQYITSKNTPFAVSESVAPYYFYNKKQGVSASHNSVVSIDIGGGTTDIVIFNQNVPILQTSVRFAANSIFGDGYGCSPSNNGFVQKHSNTISGLLMANRSSISELIDIFEEIKNSPKSEDIIAFFFSIENNSKVAKNNLPISFSKMLSGDENMKIVFLVFYCALIYHIAKLMHSKGLSSPNDITFSGTGSKTLSLIDPSSSLEALSTLSSMIFARVMNLTEKPSIELHPNSIPKEITCKGGILMDDSERKECKKAVNEVFVSARCSTKLTYENIETFAAEAIISDLNEFIDILCDCNKSFSFINNFSTTPGAMTIFADTLRAKARQHLSSGIQAKRKELGGINDGSLDESPFFYTLVGGLNELANKTSKLK